MVSVVHQFYFFRRLLIKRLKENLMPNVPRALKPLSDPSYSKASLLHQVQKNAMPIVQAIQSTPFVKLVYADMLPESIFQYYSEQDELYLISLIPVFRLLAKRLSRWPETQEGSNLLIERAALLELGVKYGTFNQRRKMTFFGGQENPLEKMPFTEQYIKHIRQAAIAPSITQALYAIIPCYLTYRYIGEQRDPAPISPTHRYKSWIKANESDSFIEFGDMLIDLAEKAAKIELESAVLPNFDRVIATALASYHYEYALFVESYKGRLLLQDTTKLGRNI